LELPLPQPRLVRVRGMNVSAESVESSVNRKKVIRTNQYGQAVEVGRKHTQRRREPPAAIQDQGVRLIDTSSDVPHRGNHHGTLYLDASHEARRVSQRKPTLLK
jgi:hypothetical protein